MADTPVEHISAAGHHETHVLASLEDLCCSLNEVFRALLICHTAKESNDFLLHVSLDLDLLASGEVNSIVHCNHLCRIDSIPVDTDVSCKLTHSHDLVSCHHTLCLKINHACIDLIVACAVIRCRVHMHYERLSCQLLSRNTCKISEPVVCVNHIKLILVLHCDSRADHSVACYLFHKVCTVFSRELVLLAVLHTKTLDLSLALLFHHCGEVLRINIRDHVASDVNELYLSEELIHGCAYSVDGHITCVDDLYGTLILVTRS